jgi:hypothetical protein
MLGEPNPKLSLDLYEEKWIRKMNGDLILNRYISLNKK